MLPDKGPWPHPYYDLDDSFVSVGFVDSEGIARQIKVRQKTLGDGPKIVLVHGLMTSSYSWRYVLAPLARRYRVFAPDLIGAGASDKPIDMIYSIENSARFLAAYVRNVSREPVYLVGNSLGGLVSLRTLLLPQGRDLARRFVLVHAPGYPFLGTKALHTILGTPGLGPFVAGLVARAAHEFPEKFVEKNVHYARADMMSKEETQEYGRLFETLDGAKVFARILDESLDPAEHARIIDELLRNRIQCPVRLLYARKDVMVPPSFGPLYKRDIPGSELVWMEDASHFVHVDAPERTVEQIFSFDPQ